MKTKSLIGTLCCFLVCFFASLRCFSQQSSQVARSVVLHPIQIIDVDIRMGADGRSQEYLTVSSFGPVEIGLYVNMISAREQFPEYGLQNPVIPAGMIFKALADDGFATGRILYRNAFVRPSKRTESGDERSQIVPHKDSVILYSILAR